MIHRRKEFSSTTKRDAYDRSNGICECHRVWQLPTYRTGCGQKLTGGNTFYEHIDCDALWGMNDLDNCAVLVKTCWKTKTATYDLPFIAENNRQRDRARNIKSQNYPPLAGTKRSGIKKPMRAFARPIDRRTGLPWASRSRLPINDRNAETPAMKPASREKQRLPVETVCCRPSWSRHRGTLDPCWQRDGAGRRAAEVHCD